MRVSAPKWMNLRLMSAAALFSIYDAYVTQISTEDTRNYTTYHNILRNIYNSKRLVKA
jgi:hypothetical protein